MSKSLNLVKYKADESGKLYEEDYEVVDSVFISPDLISKLEDYVPLVSFNVYEDSNLEEHYEIKCFPNDKTIELHSKLEELFVTVLRHEAKNFVESATLSNSKDVGYKKDSDVGLSIDRFRTITNVIYLVKLKKEKFFNEPSVVLKLG